MSRPTNSAVSQPLWAIPQSHAGATPQQPKVVPLHRPPQPKPAPGQPPAPDRALQTKAGPHLAVQTKPAFGGIVQDGYIPPDPNIAVGPNDIVELVNSEVAVFDKSTGVMASGYPKTLSSLFANLGGGCATNNAGDPIVQYDRFANRWLITELASLSAPYGECVAVSQTSDPTQAYYLYEWSFGSNLNDYPKFGIWPTSTNSAYLGTFNLFQDGALFSGAELCAFDRAAMLSGAPSPAAICWKGLTDGSYLPADVDGPNTPSDGEPGYFLNFNSTSSLGLYQMTMDFTTDTSTLIGPADIGVDPFQEACNGGTCIPQPHTKEKLDSLGDRLMYRLAYRHNADGTETMAVNQSVVAGSSVGVRWYKLDASTPGNFTVTQQGTYAPDSDYRWMGSIAMDEAGDMALGYSRSSGSTYPGIYLTGRTPSDPLNTMDSETMLQAGGGSQTGYSRWGDYTSMRIDPSDDCTFWYTDEYYPQSASYNWYTYIGSFKFTGCGSTASPSFSLAESPSPIAISAGGSDSSGTVTETALGGFTDPVSLSCADNYGITCSFSSMTTTTWTMTVTVPSSATPGSYPISINGVDSKDSSITASTNFTVDVPQPSGFTISATQFNPPTISRGSSTTDSTSATINVGGSGLVSLSVSGLPSQTTATFSPNSVTAPNTSTLTVVAGSHGPTGTFSVTVTGTSGGASQSTPINLTITK